eukprot:g1601.t1
MWLAHPLQDFCCVVHDASITIYDSSGLELQKLPIDALRVAWHPRLLSLLVVTTGSFSVYVYQDSSPAAGGGGRRKFVLQQNVPHNITGERILGAHFFTGHVCLLHTTSSSSSSAASGAVVGSIWDVHITYTKISASTSSSSTSNAAAGSCSHLAPVFSVAPDGSRVSFLDPHKDIGAAEIWGQILGDVGEMEELLAGVTEMRDADTTDSDDDPYARHWRYKQKAADAGSTRKRALQRTGGVGMSGPASAHSAGAAADKQRDGLPPRPNFVRKRNKACFFKTSPGSLTALELHLQWLRNESRHERPFDFDTAESVLVVLEESNVITAWRESALHEQLTYRLQWRSGGTAQVFDFKATSAVVRECGLENEVRRTQADQTSALVVHPTMRMVAVLQGHVARICEILPKAGASTTSTSLSSPSNLGRNPMHAHVSQGILATGIRQLLWDTTNLRNYPPVLVGVTTAGQLVCTRVSALNQAKMELVSRRAHTAVERTRPPEQDEAVDQVVRVAIKFCFTLLLFADGHVEVGQFAIRNLKQRFAVQWQMRHSLPAPAGVRAAFTKRPVVEVPRVQLGVRKRLDFVADASGAELLFSSENTIHTAPIKGGGSFDTFFTLPPASRNGGAAASVVAFDVVDDYLGILTSTAEVRIYYVSSPSRTSSKNKTAFRLLRRSALPFTPAVHRGDRDAAATAKEETSFRAWNKQGPVTDLAQGVYQQSNNLTKSILDHAKSTTSAVVTTSTLGGKSILPGAGGETWESSQVKISATATSVHWGPDAGTVMVFDAEDLTRLHLHVVPFPSATQSLASAQKPTNLYHPDVIHFLATHTNFFPDRFVQKILRSLLKGLQSGEWDIFVAGLEDNSLAAGRDAIGVEAQTDSSSNVVPAASGSGALRQEDANAGGGNCASDFWNDRDDVEEESLSPAKGVNALRLLGAAGNNVHAAAEVQPERVLQVDAGTTAPGGCHLSGWRLVGTEARDLVQLLHNHAVPFVSSWEQTILTQMLTGDEIDDHQAAISTSKASFLSKLDFARLDEAARRYLRAWIFHRLFADKFIDRAGASKSNAVVGRQYDCFAASLSSEDLVWALHSADQSALCDLILADLSATAGTPAGAGVDNSKPALFTLSDEAPTSDQTRAYGERVWTNFQSRSGLGFWLTNQHNLQACVEALPKKILQDQKSLPLQERNPEAVALWYAALNRQSLLAALYKAAKQDAIAGFLRLDLKNDAENKQKAVKNGYELIRQKRYMLAATFFLLAGCWRDAVDVVLRYLNDLGLAFLLARLAPLPAVRVSCRTSFGEEERGRVYEAERQGVSEQSDTNPGLTCDVFTSVPPLVYHVAIDEMLPMAQASNDCWLCSLALWQAGKYVDAVRALCENETVGNGLSGGRADGGEPAASPSDERGNHVVGNFRKGTRDGITTAHFRDFLIEKLRRDNITGPGGEWAAGKSTRRRGL